MSNTLGTQTNTPAARFMQQVVSNDLWSVGDGMVDAPTGHFAVIHLLPEEVAPMIQFVSDPHQRPVVTVYPGNYLLVEDSDGNATLTEFLSRRAAQDAYDELVQKYQDWCDATSDGYLDE